MNAVCGSCKAKITLVNVEPINAITVPDADLSFPDAWGTIAYLCPECRAVLGLSPNPYAMIDEIMRRIDKGGSN